MPACRRGGRGRAVSLPIGGSAPRGTWRIEGDYLVSAADELAAFPGYRFGRYDDSFSPYHDSIYDAGRTDAEGNATALVSIPDQGPAANRPLNARFAIRLAEGSGRPVERSIERTILPETPVSGTKPTFKDGVAAENSEAGFDVIAVGPDGAAALTAHWTLNQLETDYQWYALYDQWNWEVTTTRSKIAEGDLTLGAKGVSSIAPKVDWGNYELVVESSDAAQRRGGGDHRGVKPSDRHEGLAGARRRKHGSPAGGDAGGVKLRSPPQTEELVAYFFGLLKVETDGYARTEFTCDVP